MNAGARRGEGTKIHTHSPSPQPGALVPKGYREHTSLESPTRLHRKIRSAATSHVTQTIDNRSPTRQVRPQTLPEQCHGSAGGYKDTRHTLHSPGHIQ